MPGRGRPIPPSAWWKFSHMSAGSWQGVAQRPHNALPAPSHMGRQWPGLQPIISSSLWSWVGARWVPGRQRAYFPISFKGYIKKIFEEFHELMCWFQKNYNSKLKIADKCSRQVKIGRVPWRRLPDAPGAQPAPSPKNHHLGAGSTIGDNVTGA